MNLAEYREITENSEMTPEDHAFILGLLSIHKPAKILEIGVCAGGTTNLLLQALPKEATLFSVDIEKQYPRDRSKLTGYVAERHYDERTQARWVRYFGYDIASCIAEIGHGVDFTIIDTTHVLPGEFLSFLAAFPYMSDGSVLVLHDIANHALHKMLLPNPSEYQKNEFCTTLLFSAVFSREKLMSEAAVPNCGAIVLDKKMVMDNIFMVMNMLFMPWLLMPNARILGETMKIVKEFYPARDADLLEKAIQYNLREKRG